MPDARPGSVRARIRNAALGWYTNLIGREPDAGPVPQGDYPDFIPDRVRAPRAVHSFYTNLFGRESKAEPPIHGVWPEWFPDWAKRIAGGLSYHTELIGREGQDPVLDSAQNWPDKIPQDWTGRRSAGLSFPTNLFGREGQDPVQHDALSFPDKIPQDWASRRFASQSSSTEPIGREPDAGPVPQGEFPDFVPQDWSKRRAAAQSFAVNLSGREAAASGSYQATILADGPVWYSRMDAASSPAIDLINGNNASQVNSPVFASTGLLTSDPSDTAIDFESGSSQYLTAADSVPLDVADVVSIEMWIKPESVGGTMGLVSKGANSYEPYIDPAGVLNWTKAGVIVLATSSIAVVAGSTYHLVCTKNGATSKVYINGVDVTTAGTNAVLADTAIALLIGATAGGVNPFDGIIDEVAIYNVALSAAQVAAHYAAGLSAAVEAPTRASYPAQIPQDWPKRRNAGQSSSTEPIGREPDAGPVPQGEYPDYIQQDWSHRRLAAQAYFANVPLPEPPSAAPILGSFDAFVPQDWPKRRAGGQSYTEASPLPEPPAMPIAGSWPDYIDGGRKMRRVVLGMPYTAFFGREAQAAPPILAYYPDRQRTSQTRQSALAYAGSWPFPEPPPQGAATILARAFGGDDLGIFSRKRGGDDGGYMRTQGGDDLGAIARRRGGDADSE